MWPRIDLIARLQPPHFASDPDDDPGHVIAENERQAIRQNELELAVPDLGIEHVHAGGMDLYQDIIVAWLRLGHFPKPQGALFLVSIDDESLHQATPCPVAVEAVPARHRLRQPVCGPTTRSRSRRGRAQARR